MSEWHTYEVVQDGMVVASASAADRERAHREVLHYAMVYRQDGPVLVRYKRPRRRKPAAPRRTGG